MTRGESVALKIIPVERPAMKNQDGHGKSRGDEKSGGHAKGPAVWRGLLF
jgi:hypothetical protein